VERIVPLDGKNIHRTIFEGREIVLIGTAHVSSESARLVEETIGKEKPDAVCVELCKARFDAIRRKDKWQEMDIVKVIREKRASLLLLQLFLVSFQKRIAEKFHVNPGEEMVRAIMRAGEIGAAVIPADREIRITLLRAWRSMGLLMKMKLLPQLFLSLFATEKITEEDIEKLKEHDMLELSLQTMGEKFPVLKTSLIDERDQYLAHVIAHVPARKIVAVVGAGHVPGILQNLSSEIDLVKLNEIPRRGLLTRLLGWSLSLIAIGLFLVGFFTSGSQTSMKMIMWWAVITATCSALGAIILLAHPLTIAACAVTAPITTLHPLIAAGWVAGLTEAAVRKPQVRDFLDLTVDIATVRGFFRNKITRILLLIACVNLTTSIGTFVAIPVIMRLF
jgi:pheromone shutdown-related protein TraB